MGGPLDRPGAVSLDIALALPRKPRPVAAESPAEGSRDLNAPGTRPDRCQPEEMETRIADSFDGQPSPFRLSQMKMPSGTVDDGVSQTNCRHPDQKSTSCTCAIAVQARTPHLRRHAKPPR